MSDMVLYCLQNLAGSSEKTAADVKPGLLARLKDTGRQAARKVDDVLGGRAREALKQEYKANLAGHRSLASSKRMLSQMGVPLTAMHEGAGKHLRSERSALKSKILEHASTRRKQVGGALAAGAAGAAGIAAGMHLSKNSDAKQAEAGLSAAGRLGRALQGSKGVAKSVGEHLERHHNAYDLGGLGILGGVTASEYQHAKAHGDRAGMRHGIAEGVGLGVLAAPSVASVLMHARGGH